MRLKSIKVKYIVFKTLHLLSALCAQSWAQEREAVVDPVVEAYQQHFSAIVEKDVWCLNGKAHSALKENPTQGPQIAIALVNCFPDIIKKDTLQLRISADIALKADPTQGPQIAKALIYCIPDIAEELFLGGNARFATDIIKKFSLHQQQELACSYEVCRFLMWAESLTNKAVTELRDLLAPIYARAKEEQAVALRDLSQIDKEDFFQRT